MDYKLIFSLIASVLTLAAYLPYIVRLWRGRVRPQPISWAIWAAAGWIITGVIWMSGGGFAALSALIISATETAIAAAAFRKVGRHIVKPIDYFLAGVAAVALIVWIFAKDALAAALLLSFANAIGTMETIRNDWRHPLHDDATPWVLQSFSRIFMLLSLATLSLTTAVEPMVGLIGNFIIMLTVLGRGKQRLTKYLAKDDKEIADDKQKIRELRRELRAEKRKNGDK
jgi:hypothetical protein